MWLKYKNLVIIFIVIAIGLVGFKYRMRSYEYFPPVASTFDEQVLAWVGSSLINTGVPTGWSFIGDYQSKNEGHIVKLDHFSISIDGRTPSASNFNNFPKPLSHSAQLTLDGYTSQFMIVQPYIEQPPLGALLSSFLSGSYRENGFEDISLRKIRLPVIFLGTISIILVFIIAYLTYGVFMGILSSLIFALIPTVVVTQRLATAENYLSFFLLLGVISTYLWIKKEKNVFIYLTSLLIIISFLIKPFGISLAIFLIAAILVFGKPLKFLILPIISSVLAIMIFFGYGYFFDVQLFNGIVLYQGGRLISPLSGIFKIVIPKISAIFLDGWIVFGWFGIIVLLLRDKIKSDFWIFGPAIVYLFVLFIYGAEDAGWYRLPLYPFLSIASAVLLAEAILKQKVWLGLVFIMTAFSTALWWGTYGLDWNNIVLVFRLGMLFLLGLLLSSYTKYKLFKTLASLSLLILLILCFWLNIQTINKMQTIWPTLGDTTSIVPFRK